MIKKVLITSILTVILACKSDKKEKTNKDAYVVPAKEESISVNPELAESINRGSEIYRSFCVTCHLSGGEGIPEVFPPLNNSNWLTKKRKESIHAVKYGLQGPITVNGVNYDNFMPNPGLIDREVADVMNYISNSWSNTLEDPFTIEEIKAVEE